MKIKHLGIIPDGNRRWAKENGVTKQEAYNLFSDHICDIICAINNLNIEMLTIYVISKENLEREHCDIDDVLQAVLSLLEVKLPSLIKDLQVKICCVGTDNINNVKLQNTAKLIEEKTKLNNGLVVNLLIGYNPIDELNKVVSCGKKICIDNLLVPKYVDLLIRTAGYPVRLSNFLPLQCGYANIEVLENKFLDVTCKTIEEIIHKYDNIQPNYGK